jgi:hypothetical protein
MSENSRILKMHPKGIYREEDGKKIFGKSRMVFIHNGNYHLINLEIYEDGMIDCWDLISFDEFKEKIKSGWVKTMIPENSHVSVFSLGLFNIQDSAMYVKEEELIKEVQDIINTLNSKPTVSELCRDAFEKYNDDPSEDNIKSLKIAYENIPEHLAHYVLGDMQSKDYPIRDIIYNE